jgi:Zn ribbon nucleic-acid-binding protein
MGLLVLIPARVWRKSSVSPDECVEAGSDEATKPAKVKREALAVQ